MSRVHIFFLISLFFLLSVADDSISQVTVNTKDWFIEAESYFLFEEYDEALPLYQRILRADPDNLNVKYKIGICYLNDIFQYPKSVKYFEAAVTAINPKYRQNSFKERQAPPEAVYYLGRAYHSNNKFNEAIESYQKFLNLADPSEFDLDIVKADIEACQLAKELYQDPVYFSFKNLGNLINSRFEDINPVISGDGKVLAFTRRLQFYDGVFITTKNESGVWSAPVNLTAEFGLDGNSYTTGISYFGDEIFVYRSDDYDGNIYSSKRINSTWTDLEKLNENINTKYWESHASPSPDGQTLLFTSNREGGYGGLDIYKSKRGTNRKWGPAVNIGPVINSPSNEETPFLSNEGHTIFFSSQGHNTVGGYDVFISNLRSDGSWTRPKNMGYPVNNTNDNIFYTPLGVNSFGLYSFYNEEITEGLLDIYEVEVYNDMIPRVFSVKGDVTKDNNAEKIDSKLLVKLYDAASNKLIEEDKIADDGTFELKAQQGDYVLVIEGPGIETFQKNISLAVNQPASIVEIPDINLVYTEEPSKPFVADKPVVKSIILAKKDFYTVTDSAAVPIELIVEKGSDINVVVTVNDSVISEELISDVKRRFTFFYKPKPGENTLEFTATDTENNTSSTKVVINYNESVQDSEIPAEITEQEDIEQPVDDDFLKNFASEALADYLDKIDLKDFQDYYSLYQHLSEMADENGYSQNEINELFATYFTQKDLTNFNNDFNDISPQFNSIVSNVPDSLSMPLQYLDYYATNDLIPPSDLESTLVNLLAEDEETGSELYKKLTSYQGEVDSSLNLGKNISIEEAWSLFSDTYNDSVVDNSLHLATTTDNPDFFIQNLLASSDTALRNYIAEINLEKEGLINSIDIVEFLIEHAGSDTYSLQDLFDTLTRARENRAYNLTRFYELLTEEAEGNLKSELQSLGDKIDEKEDYEELLNYLLNQSKHKDYSRENVYDLLVKLTGLDQVDEFAEKFISYGFSEINNAIADTSLSHFSSPIELIQYLIVATQSYDFAASDINNLLIRMILERGLDEQGGNYYKDELSKNFWKSRRFISTVVLVNILLLILVILFSIRKRNKGNNMENL